MLSQCWARIVDGYPIFKQRPLFLMYTCTTPTTASQTTVYDKSSASLHGASKWFFIKKHPLPVSLRHWPDVGIMLGRRRRRWPNIIPALGQRLMLTGYSLFLRVFQYKVFRRYQQDILVWRIIFSLVLYQYVDDVKKYIINSGRDVAQWVQPCTLQ